MLGSITSITHRATRSSLYHLHRTPHLAHQLPSNLAISSTHRSINTHSRLTQHQNTINYQSNQISTTTSPPGIQSSIFAPLDTFPARHVGPRDEDIQYMLTSLGYESLDQFVNEVVPDSIRTTELTNLQIPALSESQLSKRAEELAAKNVLARNYIGMGYWNAVMPPAIARNVSLFS